MSESEHNAASGMPPVIAIGVSDAGLDALVTVLQGLPLWITASILVRVDGPAPSADSVLARLRAAMWLPVLPVAGGERVTRRTVHVIGSDRLVVVDPRGRFHVLPGRGRSRWTPGLDPLLASLARVAGPSCAVVLLGRHAIDGMGGVRRLVQAGGAAILQDSLRPLDDRDVGAWILPAHRIAGALTALTLMPGARPWLRMWPASDYWYTAGRPGGGFRRTSSAAT